MRGVTSVQRNHLFVCNLWPQRGGPALQHVLGQQHGLASPVQGPLRQTVDAAQRAALPLFDFDGLQRLAPQAFALARSKLRPRGARIGAALRGYSLHRRTARVPLDQQIDLAAQFDGLLQRACDQVLRAKARVRAQQQRCCAHRAGRAQGALDVVLALTGAVLAARAQVQLQAVAACAQVQRNGAVTIDSGVGVGHAFLGGVALVHHEGVDVQRQVAAGQGAKVDGRAIDVQAEHGAVDLVGQFAPCGAHGVKALAQCGARRHAAQTQRLVGKALGAKALDSFEIVLAQGEQGQVALENVAVGNPCAHRIRRIDHRGQIDALEQAPDQGQPTMAAQIVGQLLDYKIDRLRHLFLLHPLGARQMMPKCLIYMGIYPHQGARVTDSGSILRELIQFGWQPVQENRIIIGLKREAASVSLEPGGQLEFSGAPHGDMLKLLAELEKFLTELHSVCERLAITIVCTGYRPVGSVNSVGIVPRKRYRQLMPLLTEQANMAAGQKMTASMQVSLDYTSEQHAGRLLQLGLKCQPLVIAMFGNSPLYEGRLSRWNSYRMYIWSRFGSQRAGVPSFMLNSDFPQRAFEHYARWALEKPLLFIHRAADILVVRNISFSQFLRTGWSGYRATLNDWVIHLGTLFPEARLKNIVEMRSADACNPLHAAALAAFWKGLAYSDEALEEALSLLRDFNSSNLHEIYATASRLGLENGGARSLRDLSLNLLSIADRELSRQMETGREATLLASMIEAVKAGRSPSSALIDVFRREGPIAALKATALNPKNFLKAAELSQLASADPRYCSPDGTVQVPCWGTISTAS